MKTCPRQRSPSDALLEKLKSTSKEVRARGGQLITLCPAKTRSKRKTATTKSSCLPFVEYWHLPIPL